MALTDITKTIHEEAEQKRQQILADADKKIDALKASYKAEQDKREAAFSAVTEQIKAQNVATVTGAAERERKEIVDGIKRQLVNEVFEKALDTMTKLADADYKAIIAGYLKALPKNLGKCDVYASPKHVAATKKALADASFSGSVHEDKNIMHGGLKVVGSNFEYDFTFDKLMQEYKNALEIEIAHILFGSEE